MESRVPTGRQGFTLIEVMVALVILTLGLLMLDTMQMIAIKANASSFDLSAASTLGQEALEQLQTYNVATDTSLAAGNHTAATEAATHPTLIPDQTINGLTYTRSYAVTTNSPILGIRTVSLTVSWSNQGRAHSLSLSERIRG